MQYVMDLGENNELAYGGVVVCVSSIYVCRLRQGAGILLVVEFR
jgi:hypothetical protein